MMNLEGFQLFSESFNFSVQPSKKNRYECLTSVGTRGGVTFGCHGHMCGVMRLGAVGEIR
jgi:hypothetical protein